MLAAAVAGIWAYRSLGREEDPPFTIKTMVVKTLWPGATTRDTLSQVTDRIEKKLEELPYLDFVRSYTKPGESVVFVNLKDTVAGKIGARSLVSGAQEDRRHPPDLAAGHLRSVLQRRVRRHLFAHLCAHIADGFTHRELRDHADGIRAELLRVRDVAKVDLIGEQDEKIYLEFSTPQIAALGLDASTLISGAAGAECAGSERDGRAGPERIAIRVSGEFTSEESLKAINFRANGPLLPLSDIAQVKRTYVDPPQPMFRFNGAAGDRSCRSR